MDNLTVTVYDGEGGQCIADAAQNISSVRVGCFTSSVRLQVGAYIPIFISVYM